MLTAKIFFWNYMHSFRIRYSWVFFIYILCVWWYVSVWLIIRRLDYFFYPHSLIGNWFVNTCWWKKNITPVYHRNVAHVLIPLVDHCLLFFYCNLSNWGNSGHTIMNMLTSASNSVNYLCLKSKTQMDGLINILLCVIQRSENMIYI